MRLSGQGYICSAGESFDSVALSVYGDEMYAADLLCANPELGGKMNFEGGEILRSCACPWWRRCRKTTARRSRR